MIRAKTLFGAATYTGTDGNDVLKGGKADDVLIGSRGFDTISGGNGNDTVSYIDSPFIQVTGPDPDPGFIFVGDAPLGVTVDLAAGTATKKIVDIETFGGWSTTTISSATDTLLSIENVVGGNFNDTIFGSSQSNQLQGMGGDDLLDGRDGNDILSGRTGNDTLIGGNGSDTLFGGESLDVLIGGAGADYLDGGASKFGIEGNFASYETSASAVQVDLLLKGPQQSSGDAQGDILKNIGSVRGSAFNDTIIVNGGFAYGLNGSDTLSGTSQSDTLVGGTGADLLYGGNGDDVLFAETNPGNGNIGTIGPYDQLFGGGGNDTLIGGIAIDFLYGGEGDDIYDVGANDFVSDSGGNDTVRTDALSYTLGSGIENLTFYDTFFENHTGHGNELDNVILGGWSDDTLHAYAGADIIDAGGGNNLIEDLWGTDTVVMNWGFDTVMGFDATDGLDHDVISMQHFGVSNLDDFYANGGSIQQVGTDVEIRLGTEEGWPVMILKDVSISDIDDTDFYFA